MNNYQLYRTSPLLGGQMKWDIIVDSDASDLYVSDFHITPISEQISYNRYSYDTLLNYSHQYNIKKYYEKVSGSFYQNITEPQLNHNWPIISNKYEKSYDDTYLMGCRRSKYDIYKKQFEFLCPLWLEKIDSDITFIINILNPDNNDVIATKSLKLVTAGDYEYHNSFVKYLNNYIDYAGLNDGDDNVINIKLDKKVAAISGLDVKIGENMTKDISSLVTNILLRERPLLEVDSMIINSFSNNNMICKQLFNFNICFNIEDIISHPYLYNMMRGDKFKVECVAKIGDNILDIKDLYNNYNYIPKKYYNIWRIDESKLDETLPTPPNVLDYMEDYKCIDLIDKNKSASSIFHWSLLGNNDYIFNIYDGFSGWTYKDGEITQHSHLYNDTPDIAQDIYNESLHNINWVNTSIIDVYDQYYATLLDRSDDHIYSIFGKGYEWVNNIKYDTSFIKDGDIQNIKVILCKIENYNSWKNKNIGNVLYDGGYYQIYYNTFSISDMKYIIFSLVADRLDDNVYNSLTFGSIKKLIENHENQSLSFLYNIMKNVVKIPLVVFKKSLYISKADGPALSSSEIMYYKNDDNYMNYVFRYDGNIRPTFIDIDSLYKNELYYKIIMTEDEIKNSVYAEFNNSKYPPKYPSIDYYPFRSVEYNYNSPDGILVDSEYKWFNNSNILYLTPSIQCSLKSEIDKNGQYKKIEYLVKEYLKKYYKIDDISYIYDKYNWKSSYEYETQTNIENYIYNINLTLK